MGHEPCCQIEKETEEEFFNAVSFSTCDEKTSSAVRVKAMAVLGGDDVNELEPYLQQVPEYPGFPCLLTGRFDECAADKAADDGPSNGRESYDQVCGDKTCGIEEDCECGQTQELVTVAPEGVPLVEGVEVLSPELIQDLVRSRKCVLVDVRGADRASGHIDGAMHVPAISMSSPFVVRLPELVQNWKNERLIVFFCQFCKHRAPHCANLYRALCDSMQRVAVLDGGFRAWESKGLPVRDGGASISQRASADAWALHQGSLIRSEVCIA